MNERKKTWIEFRDSGLLWWINMILHTFGWAIIVVINDDEEAIDVYPARVDFRGFSETCNTKGYNRITQYMKNHVDELLEETKK